ncbi:SRPBCC family protein [Methylogaea oryzae]|nr:SRPBCC family protein [Methylogaea oryzae]
MRKTTVLPMLAACLVFAIPADAHGPTPQKVDETVEIAAPPEKVWAVVKDFAGIAQWNPAVSRSTGEGGNSQGAHRTLVFANGEPLAEDLDFYDEAGHEYRYRLRAPNVKALPASSYSATLKLTPVDGKTSVSWKSRLYRGDTGNFPPDELNDEAAVNAMRHLVRTGLDRLKQLLETAGR